MHTAESILEELFSPAGLLPQHIPYYEAREGQQGMAHEILEAFKNQESALFEAGTGIGKSLAYLIPSFLWNYQTEEKVVISTHTISLQQQLLEKDIPLVKKILGLNLRVVLVKGMSNYLCIRKLEELSLQADALDKTLCQIERWAQKTVDGTKSDLTFSLPADTWKTVCASSEDCSYVKCPHYKQCFFFKARAKVQTADILIINHHLLMAHLLSEEKQPLLPTFSRLVIDEAHHLENVAKSAFAKELDKLWVFSFLSRLHSDANPLASLLLQLSTHVLNPSLKTRLQTDLVLAKKALVTKIQAAFDMLDQNEKQLIKWRITEKLLQSATWQNLTGLFLELKEEFRKLNASLRALRLEMPGECQDRVEAILTDIELVADKLQDSTLFIQTFFQEFSDQTVRWAERKKEGTILSVALLDISTFLNEKLFSSLKSTILCSATLSIENTFTHLKNNLGIKEEVRQKVYPSPFDFKNRTKLLGIADLVDPTHPNFLQEACFLIQEALKISKGGAFVLFTSYEMLNKCAKTLTDFSILKQGDLSRHLLLEEFKNQKNGILLGTDSFWEGVDVAGEALRLVIIVKLPFLVPNDPMVEARADFLKKHGKDPFLEDSLPQAVMKFKQGFGRLMRRKEDRGCVLCLDQRLFTRPYGKTFFKSLPDCAISYQKKEKILQEMKNFYGA